MIRLSARVVIGAILCGSLMLSIGCKESPTPEPRDEAMAALAEGRLADAADQLATLVARDPADAALQLLYGRTLMRIGSYTRAIFPLRRAMESPDLESAAASHLAQLYVTLGEAPGALEAIDTVLAVEPENLDARKLRVHALSLAKRGEEALAAAEEVLAAAPDDPEAGLLRFQTLLALGRVDDAVGALEVVQEQLARRDDTTDATQAQLCTGAAVFAKERGQREAAEAAFERCLGVDPDGAPAPVLVREASAFFDEIGENDRATTLWRTAHEAAPKDLQRRVDFALRLRAIGRPEEAIGLLEAATTTQPDAWLAIADAHAEDEAFGPAAQALDLAITAHDEPRAGWLLGLAEYRLLAGDLEGAEAVLDRLKLPDHRPFIEGRLQHARGHYEMALERLEEAVRLRPDKPAYRYLAGLAADRAGRYEIALEHYKEASRSESPPLEAALAYARVSSALATSPVPADGVLMRVLSTTPDKTTVLKTLAELRLRANSRDLAQKALRTLGHVANGHPEVVALSIREAHRRGGIEAALGVAESSKVDLTDPAYFKPLATLARFLARANRGTEAADLCAAAVEANGGDARLLSLQAEILINLNSTARASRMAAEARSLAPHDADVLIAYSRVALASDRPADALEAAEQALMQSTRGEAIVEAARAEHALGRPDAARLRLSTALDETPHDPDIARAYAELLVDSELGDEAERRRAARRASMFDGSAVSLLLYGRSLFELGELDEARRVLASALAHPTDSASRIEYYLGRVATAARREDDARDHLRRAVGLAPFRELADARARLAALEAAGT